MLFSAIFDRNIALLNRQVLVLNRLWQAVNVTTVRRAFTLLCQGRAQIVSADGKPSMPVMLGRASGTKRQKAKVSCTSGRQP